MSDPKQKMISQKLTWMTDLFIFFIGGNEGSENCRDTKSEVRDLISQ